MRRRAVMTARWAGVLMLAATLGACGNPGKVSAENDRLREENMELRQRVEALKQQIVGIETRVTQLKNQLNGKVAKLPEGVDEPVCASIQIGEYSGGVDTDGDAADDLVRVYIETIDGNSRFVQVVATAKVSVAVTPAEGEARTVGSVSIDAKAFDAAYRSAFMVTHYTLECPVKGVPAGTKQLTVSVSMHDLLTGKTHEEKKLVPWSGK